VGYLLIFTIGGYVVENQKSVKMSERAQFVRVGKMRCVATGRPAAQDHAEGPHGNLMDFRGALASCRRISAPSGRLPADYPIRTLARRMFRSSSAA
jgi:hypothetical protein